MKFKFRVTLLTIFLGLIGMLVLTLGITSFWNEHKTAHDLTQQILEQLSFRISDQGKHQLTGAGAEVSILRKSMQSEKVHAENFPALVHAWIDVMNVRQELARLSLGTPNGDWLYLGRHGSGRIMVGVIKADPKTGKRGFSNYWASDYPNNPFYTHPDLEKGDPRTRPWYTEAVKANDQIWTDSYVFLGTHGVEETPGISCAAPIHDKNGTLLGVVAASIDLYRICADLKDMPVAQNGFAFLIELRDDGTRWVIGHPDPSVILREVRVDGVVHVSELVPADECSDHRIRSFLKSLPKVLPKDNRLVAMQFHSEGTPFLGAFRHVNPADGPEAIIGMMLPESDIMADVYRNNWITVGVGLSVVLLAVLLSLGVSSQVARPIEGLVAETEAVGNFNVEPRTPFPSVVEEVDRLGQSIEQMKSSLRSFRKYVPADLVRNLLASGMEARLGGVEREVSIFFCDLAGFTSLSEGLTAQALVEQLGEYFRAFTEEILATGGTVDKFIGDAVMAFWGAPVLMPDHALAACHCALRCQQRLQDLRVGWRAQGKPELHARIGINTGNVVVGNIGSEHRLNYTVIGDPVNVASRLEGLNKFYGTEIMLSDTTRKAVGDAVVVRGLDWVSVKGKKEGGKVYQLLGLKGEVPAEVEERAKKHGQALECYRARDWDQAIKLFEEVLRVEPGDKAAEEILRRCSYYRLNPPLSEWDGIHHMENK